MDPCQNAQDFSRSFNQQAIHFLDRHLLRTSSASSSMNPFKPTQSSLYVLNQIHVHILSNTAMGNSLYRMQRRHPPYARSPCCTSESGSRSHRQDRPSHSFSFFCHQSCTQAAVTSCQLAKSPFIACLALGDEVNGIASLYPTFCHRGPCALHDIVRVQYKSCMLFHTRIHDKNEADVDTRQNKSGRIEGARRQKKQAKCSGLETHSSQTPQHREQHSCSTPVRSASHK